MDEARPAIGAFGLREKILQALDRNFAALRVPAELGGLGEAVDLAGLNANAAGREAVRPALDVKPFDKAAGGGVPPFARPQGQRMVDDQCPQCSNDFPALIPEADGLLASHLALPVMAPQKRISDNSKVQSVRSHQPSGLSETKTRKLQLGKKPPPSGASITSARAGRALMQFATRGKDPRRRGNVVDLVDILDHATRPGIAVA